jgi:hypothetical protein
VKALQPCGVEAGITPSLWTLLLGSDNRSLDGLDKQSLIARSQFAIIDSPQSGTFNCVSLVHQPIGQCSPVIGLWESPGDPLNYGIVRPVVNSEGTPIFQNDEASHWESPIVSIEPPCFPHLSVDCLRIYNAVSSLLPYAFDIPSKRRICRCNRVSSVLNSSRGSLPTTSV